MSICFLSVCLSPHGNDASQRNKDFCSNGISLKIGSLQEFKILFALKIIIFFGFLGFFGTSLLCIVESEQGEGLWPWLLVLVTGNK